MKEDKAKENMKKRKKRSLIRKIIKIILLLILVAIIGYACYFAYNYHRHTSEMGEKEYDPLSATALGIDPAKLAEVGRINILVLGESNANQGSDKDKTPYYLTDTIMIVSYNPQTQQASILSIPRDTYVGKKDKKSASQNYLQSYKMNAVYRNRTNVDETLECVSNVTGLDLKNYILIDTDAIVDVVDAIGGVWFNVPIDMDYEDLNQDLYIHLKAGEQLIDGNKAEQLLRFRHNQDGTSYPSEYGDNDLGRMRTQREFIQETAKQLLRIENAPKIVSLLDIVFKNVRTNLEMQEMKYYIPYAFKFNTENIVTDVLPGTPELCNGVWIFTADRTKTKQVVEDLFTDKVVVEEPEGNGDSSNSNTIENGSIANNGAVNGKANAAESATEKGTANAAGSTAENGAASNSSEKQNSGATNNSGEKENKQEAKNITIELLNGTSNSKVLEEVKEKLKQKGYTISKSGTINKTQKTTIINRTKQKNATSSQIKETLGIGAITTGSDNSKVDYTIIIGEDYK